MHRQPVGRFFYRRGSYRPQCRTEPVPRFACRTCKRSFSRQTFRLDYRDRKPGCNVPMLQLLVSGVGLRQIGRTLGLGIHGAQHKFRKIAFGLRRLNRNLLRKLPPGHRTFLFDEMETFEHSSILRLSVSVLIEQKSLAVLAVDVAPIRRVPRQGSARRKWLDRHEQEHGRRRDQGRASVRRVLGRFRRLLGGEKAELRTDEKGLYAALLRRMLPEIEHRTTISTLPRTTYNPLFRINLTDAMLRDNNGRMRWRTWLVSKKRGWLRQQLEVFAAWRNWHRPRTNADERRATPGVFLGLTERSFQCDELLAWRQDWRERSIHPTSADGALPIGFGPRRQAA
jgi:hypothetical protein